MTKETKKLIRYSIALSPIISGGLLLIFGDASDLYSQMVIGLSVPVTASLVFYNYQEDDQNKRKADPCSDGLKMEKVDGKWRMVSRNPDKPDLFETQTRCVDQALIVSLWFFGAIGVLCSGLALHLEIYFQTITALAVMYVLLVAFRIDRLVRRTAEEEEFTVDLMGEALYWNTIYRSEVEKVIGRWKDIDKNQLGKNMRETIENIVIEKKEQSPPSDIMEEEIIEELVKALAEEGVEDLVKELQRKDPSIDPSKENFEKAVELKKEPFRRLITDECAKNLLAGNVMAEVMERIDKGKFEGKLIDDYRASMEYIDALEEWEMGKAHRPAHEMEIAKLKMLKMEEDKPQGWEMEKAKLKRRVQEWEEEKANPPEKIDERIVKFKKFRTDFTKYINSRQQGYSYTELIAIGAIGFVLVVLMNLGFPEVITGEVTTEGITKVITERITGFGAFSVYLFTLFTSTIVVFLFFRILDLENDRDRSLHDVVPGYFGSGYSKLWKEVFHRTYESPNPKWIVTISAVTTIVYMVLLWGKNW